MNKLQNIKIRLITLRLLVLRDRYPMPPRGKTCPYIGYIIHQCVDINALANLKNLTRAHVVLEVYLYVKFMLFLTKVKISLLKKMKHLFSLLAFDTKLMKLLSKINTLIKKVRFHKKLDGREEAVRVKEESTAGLFYSFMTRTELSYINFDKNKTTPYQTSPLLLISSKIKYYPLCKKIELNYICKRSMMTFKRILPKTSLVKLTSLNIIQRKPSYMAPNTLLKFNDYLDIKQILLYHKQYLLNLDLLKDKFDDQIFDFYENIMLTNPKIFQHILSILYPRAKYSLLDLQRYYPQLDIFGKKNDSLITEDVLVAATAGNVMKNHPIFKEGQLKVLGSGLQKKEVMNKIALKQTKQQNPDYLYVYNQKLNNGKLNANGHWTRYYDLKAGKFKPNTGHIFCTSNKEQFEDKIAELLRTQQMMYNGEEDIDFEYKRVLENKNLSWLERSYQIQEFFKHNLYKYPQINPSFILYNPEFRKINNQFPSKSYDEFITQENMNNVENSRKMLSKVIHADGEISRDNYRNHPYNCPKIVGFIEDLIKKDS